MATSVNGVGGDQQVERHVRYFMFTFLEGSGFDAVDQQLTPPDGDDTSRAIAKMGLEFKERYAPSFEEMFGNLDLTANTAHATFVGISNELFSGGIKWGTILALFVLGGELAIRSLGSRNAPRVTEIEAWLKEYIEQHLSVWIRDHGGWEGFQEYFKCDKEGSWMRPMIGLATSLCGAIKGLIFRT